MDSLHSCSYSCCMFQLSFRSVQRSIEESARQVFVLLGITDFTSEEDADSEINGHLGRKIAGVSIGGDGEDGGSSNSSTPTGSVSESTNSFKSGRGLLHCYKS